MEKEKKDFVIKRGVLGWGIPFWLIVSFLQGFQKPDAGIFDFGSFNFKVFFSYSLICLPVSLIAGFFWGLWMWGLLKKQKKK
jgi:hypothetical protein